MITIIYIVNRKREVFSMARSQAEKVESHKAIVSEAARLFRKHGIETTSVADVMAAAKLTHGGFYRHFKSKEELAAAAIRLAFDDILAKIEAAEKQEGPLAAARAYASMYLSPESVAYPEASCPIPALGGETARLSGEIAEATAERIDKTISTIAKAFEGSGSDARKDAAFLIASLVGTVLLARSAAGKPVAEEVLAAARERFEVLLR
jgi:TetR/AcrR family transcriptional repressor of nem operon